jgi:hypothetical protein
MEPIETVEQRIAALERRVRRITAVAVAALGCLAGCVALSASDASPSVLRARRIEVVDSTGRVRIVLDPEFMGPDVAGLRVSSADGGSVAELWAGLFEGPEGGSTHGAVVNVEADFDDGSDCSHTRISATGIGANVVSSCGTSRTASLAASTTVTSVELSTGFPSFFEDDGDVGITTEYRPSISLSEKDGNASIAVIGADGTKKFEAP